MNVTPKIFSHPTYPTATFTPPYYAYAFIGLESRRGTNMTTVGGQRGYKKSQVYLRDIVRMYDSSSYSTT